MLLAQGINHVLQHPQREIGRTAAFYPKESQRTRSRLYALPAALVISIPSNVIPAYLPKLERIRARTGFTSWRRRY